MNNYQEFYHRNGYLVVPGLFSPSEIQALRTETAAIFRGERGEIEGLLPVGNNDTDEDVLRRYVAIHFPHKLSTDIKEVFGHSGVIEVLKDIVGPNLKAMQSMLFVKGPGKAGQAWHQDEYYIPTRDRSLVGVWIAIDDANLKNGCLWIIPGSHKSGYMMQRVPNIDTEFADVDTIDINTWNGEPIPVEVKAGDVVFFNGYTLHSSRKNHTADCFRTALVNHYMSAESMLPWNQDGKLAATEDLRDILMVSGFDPYAWKSTVDVNKPYLRPEVLNIKTEV